MRRFTMLSLLLLATACGDTENTNAGDDLVGDNSANNAPVESLAAGEFCDRIKRAQCEHHVSCCDGSEPGFPAFASVDECVIERSPFCSDGSKATLEQLVQDGVVAINPEVFEGCLERIDSDVPVCGAADIYLSLRCLEAIEGTLPDGEACEPGLLTERACASGRCDFSTSVCIPMEVIGEDCFSRDACDLSLGHACERSQCAEAAPNGGDCNANLELYDFGCQSGFCDGETQTCQAPGAIESCAQLGSL